MDGLLKSDTKLEDWFKIPTFVGFFVYGMMGRFGEGDSFGQETYITTTYISLFRGYFNS